MIIVAIFLGKTSASDIGTFKQSLDSFSQSYDYKGIYVSANISHDAERYINEYAMKYGIRLQKIQFPQSSDEQYKQTFVSKFATEIAQTRLSPIILSCGDMNDLENAIIGYAVASGIMVVDLLQ